MNAKSAKNKTRASASVLKNGTRAAVEKVLARFTGDCVGIIAEGRNVAFRKNFDHPAVKVVHWVVHDGLKSTIVFSMSFLNVVFQSDADVFVFTAQPDLLWT